MAVHLLFILLHLLGRAALCGSIAEGTNFRCTYDISVYSSACEVRPDKTNKNLCSSYETVSQQNSAGAAAYL